MIIAYLIENAKNKRANFISCMILDILPLPLSLSLALTTSQTKTIYLFYSFIYFD